MSPSFSSEAAVNPVPQPTPTLSAQVNQQSAQSFNHFFGSVTGNMARYSDVGSFAWYLPGGGGFDTRGAPKNRMRRYPTGLEDSDNLKTH